jgi:hypothetical protein
MTGARMGETWSSLEIEFCGNFKQVMIKALKASSGRGYAGEHDKAV